MFVVTLEVNTDALAVVLPLPRRGTSKNIRSLHYLFLQLFKSDGNCHRGLDRARLTRVPIRSSLCHHQHRVWITLNHTVPCRSWHHQWLVMGITATAVIATIQEAPPHVRVVIATTTTSNGIDIGNDVRTDPCTWSVIPALLCAWWSHLVL